MRSDGTVKVLDFGLAKALDPMPSGPNKLANSPTLSMQATQAGTIPGTAAYMSPEQAAGKAADRRSDVSGMCSSTSAILTSQLSRRYRARPFAATRNCSPDEPSVIVNLFNCSSGHLVSGRLLHTNSSRHEMIR